MSKRFSKKEIDEIVKLHNDGYNTVKISEVTKKSQSGIERFLKRNGFSMHIKTRASVCEIEDIKNMYIEGKTCKEIQQKYKHIYKSIGAIEKIIKKSGLSRGHYSKPVVLNHDYFENIDSENKAYWIGFLLADGCILEYKNKSKKIKLELQFKDKYIIERFANDVGSDLCVLDYKYKKKHNASISLSSNKMANDLEKFQIVKNKTLKINKIPEIKIEMFRHFVRGYFDGDGCIFINKPKDQNLHRARITFCGTELFLEDLNIFLSKNLGLKYKKLTDMNKYGSNVFNLIYSANKDIVKLYNYFYKDSNIYLKRKKEKFDLFLKERNLI